MDLYVAGFAWAFAAHWLLTFALVGIIACWFLLATALNPSAFLPFGMAAVTLATVATSTFAQLMLAANTVKEVGESYPSHHPHPMLLLSSYHLFPLLPPSPLGHEQSLPADAD